MTSWGTGATWNISKLGGALCNPPNIFRILKLQSAFTVSQLCIGWSKVISFIWPGQHAPVSSLKSTPPVHLNKQKSHNSSYTYRCCYRHISHLSTLLLVHNWQDPAEFCLKQILLERDKERFSKPNCGEISFWSQKVYCMVLYTVFYCAIIIPCAVNR